jgi:dTDP-4-dehydrorhamnose 3,5-epimerase-like enzyme
MDCKIETIKKHHDERGELVVFLKRSQLDKKSLPFGQIYFITFEGKGVIRGNHYHEKWREWFGIVHGEVRAELEDIVTKERRSCVLSADHSTYTRLEIGPHIAHAFRCLSPSAALLNYADAEWTAQDRFEYPLIKEYHDVNHEKAAEKE